jgi:hypothetical protein
MLKTPIALLLTTGSLVLGALALPAPAAAQISFSVTIGPPPLPVYEQPPIPAAGYIWVPGYWYYGPYGYYWVPGTWVQPPDVGLLWTPGYWGWSGGFFVWNPGYWAPQIGFYGGVNYGFGYFGHGYDGGYWRGNRFYYNREVTNITNVHIENVYSRTVVNNTTVNRISYVGGPGGIKAQPTAEEERVAHEHHTQLTSAQLQHRTEAAGRPELAASVNHGKPTIAATSRSGAFDSHVVSASSAGGPVSVHARDLPRPGAAPGPAKPPAGQEAEYQRQSALQAQHQQERDNLAQMQERDHAYLDQQHANAQAQAAMEHQHRQQTEFLQQRQATEMQGYRQPPPQQHAAPPPPSRGEPSRGEPPRGEPPRR